MNEMSVSLDIQIEIDNDDYIFCVCYVNTKIPEKEGNVVFAKNFGTRDLAYKWFEREIENMKEGDGYIFMGRGLGDPRHNWADKLELHKWLSKTETEKITEYP